MYAADCQAAFDEVESGSACVSRAICLALWAQADACVAHDLTSRSYLVVPSVAGFPLEAHPFTIVNAPGDRGVNPDDGEVTFLLRVRDGFTKRLFMAAEAHRSLDEKQIGNAQTVQRLPVYVEGPYGASKTSSHHDAVSLIAGRYCSPDCQNCGQLMRSFSCFPSTGGTGITFAFSRFCQLHREMREGKARTKTLRLIWIVRSAGQFVSA